MTRQGRSILLLAVAVVVTCSIAVMIVIRPDAENDTTATDKVTTEAGDAGSADGDAADPDGRSDADAPPSGPHSPVDPGTGGGTDRPRNGTGGDRERVDPWAPLRRIDAWRMASDDARRAAVERVEHVAPEFEFATLRPGANGVAVATFRHARSEMEFVLVPAGTFVMGSPESDPHHHASETEHEVRLTSAFLIATTEVTQAQWVRVMGTTNPSKFRGDNLPVERVSWLEARAYCTTVGLDLPTEAQWERACRAGTTSVYSFGDLAEDAPRHAWFADNSEKRSHPVGTKEPNSLGLFDMHGNVYEWCRDGYRRHDANSAVDPIGPPNALGRVFRGGSWMTGVDGLRSAARKGYKPEERLTNVGFRPAKSLPLDR